ncbi:hypothetical protein C6P46_004238 [Rhodotorula mucilaginosa]|uniref:Peptidase M20 dimerisation domain-containing protein n=1 Tax=Rhodotorula mucilaginosa TaxID=5537 RepID=A0A9P7B679_RHOMI|nr:hypothetical protein C6P46_004238 [Rhodotorula mucilaginosa]TKA52215.1 hypothetical protein B0A53_04638 [Rhodotorula sp. CCFEE 5036]
MSQPGNRAAPAATAGGPSSRRLTLLALVVPLALAFFGSPDTASILPASVHSFVQELTSSFDLKSLNTVVPACPSQPPARDIGPDWTPLDEPGYKTLAVERLVGAIRTRTETFDDYGTPYTDPRFDKFAAFHDYLESSFPSVFATLQVEKPQKFGLLVTYAGKKGHAALGAAALKPIVLMAHQDTVPVDPGTVPEWEHPPFSGHLDEAGWIWGRGAIDCKNTLVGILAAFERLLKEGFVPDRDIILSSSFDEEIGGFRAARHIAAALEERYGRNGVAMIVDEGFGGIVNVFDRTFAMFAVAEKGAVSLQLDVASPGGHSSMPPKYTSIGVLAKLISALEDNADQPALRLGSPKVGELQCYAEHGKMGTLFRKSIQSPVLWPYVARQLSKRDKLSQAALHTTQAVDLIHGGVKLNALPESATAMINYRIEYTSSVNATIEHTSSVIEPIVKKLGLAYDKLGSKSNVTQNVVRLSVVEHSAYEPAPITRTEGPTWDLMVGTAKHLWPGAIAGPTGMMANTDTKHSWNLTRNIYRFVPATIDQVKGFHTINEAVHTDAHLSAIRFFYKLIRNTEGWTYD